MKNVILKYTSINQIAFFVFALLTILVPLSFWTGFENKIDLVKASVFNILSGLLIIIACIYYAIELKKNKLSGLLSSVKLLDILILVFLTSVIISTALSSNFYVSFNGSYNRQIGLLFFLNLVLIYFFSKSFLNDENRLKKILSVMEIMGLITSLFIITGYFGNNILNLTPENSLRPYSNIGNPVFSAGFITIVFPISLLNVTNKKNILIRIIFPLIMFFGIILTLTRTAYIAVSIEILLALIMLPIIYGFKRSKLKKFYFYSVSSIIFSILLIIALIYSFPENEFIKRLLSFTTLTSQPRWYLWKDSIKMFLDYPLTGTGPGLFSNIFENYASYNLRFADMHGTYDHAHNNFINIFSTTGITGGLSYLLIFVYVIFKSGKIIFAKNQGSNLKFFYLFILCSLSGYIIYGLADFDEISILFYLFVLLSVFKSKYSTFSDEKYFNNYSQYINYARYVFYLSLIVFSTNNIYSTLLKISAEKDYAEGVQYYNSGKFYESINSFNKAIFKQPEQAQYRYAIGIQLLMYCTEHKELTKTGKEIWLNKAREEINNASQNYPYRLDCLSVLSLIELERGNEEKANLIKSEIFETDSCKTAYRLKLAKYYLENFRESEAIQEIEFVNKYDFKNTDALSFKAIYLKQINKYEEAEEVCRKILEINPKNIFAASMISRLKSRTSKYILGKY